MAGYVHGYATPEQQRLIEQDDPGPTPRLPAPARREPGAGSSQSAAVLTPS